ncbi:hypothetical protein ACFWY9_30240 [Amycolatopsis sp. NPDC059027]|uniref:hypothetical protein n=1 Tax=unclassified Amycolatopsis TaxID=2618356 RepID=UPI003671695B
MDEGLESNGACEQDGPDASPTLVNRMISVADEQLLRGFVGRLKWTAAEVDSLRRFGFSDSYMYVLRPADGSGQPHVAKIGPASKIRRERRAWHSVRGYLETDDVIHCSDSEARRAGLCFRLRSRTGRDTDVVELDDYYRKALVGDGRAKDELMEHLTEVYDTMSGAHHVAPIIEKRTYRALFTRYLRTGASTNRAQLLFRGDGTPLEICGHVVSEDPLHSLPKLLDRTVDTFYVCAVHGDLHLSNVVISRGRPHLVDYEWAGLRDHLAKDFVLMESSLRFMRFPRHVHPRVLLQVDRLLNSEWDVEVAREGLSAKLNRSSAVAVNCMLDVVGTIRRQFESIVMQFMPIKRRWMREYFTCLYLILAGQQRFDTFPLTRTVINLQQLEQWTQELGGEKS